MQIAIAKEYLCFTDYDREDALEWCKACLQRRINKDHLEDQIDWSELIVKEKKIDEFGWWLIECRLPLHELFYAICKSSSHTLRQ